MIELILTLLLTGHTIQTRVIYPSGAVWTCVQLDQEGTDWKPRHCWPLPLSRSVRSDSDDWPNMPSGTYTGQAWVWADNGKTVREYVSSKKVITIP